MKRLVAFLLCTVMVGATTVGCSNTESSSSGTTSQETESLASEDNTASIDISGQKIVVCTESGEAADGVGAQIDAFKEKYGCDVELVDIPADVYKTKIQTDLAAQSGSFDVIVGTCDFA